MKLKKVVKVIDTATLICAVVGIACALTGCFSDAGWQFNIGVTPVTAIDHHETLTPKIQNAKY